ncbi:MFS transporter [Phytohabitans aurantiacus]|uniref:MFS transporter n=1 Tax=Phytohabitans aurantiacus TaxID=3016789 RepID=A0ABQ5QXF6_9ACTN|nr:MFS transporter [Phytohabitans aurantiacus]GLH99213.1 MFS transporter [Phytohabitans aurantiacus]
MSNAHPRRWWILGVLCLALLVLGVDNMILNLAIPSLMRDLGASPADVQWIMDAYILAFAGALITAGGLSDRYGRRLALVVGLSVLGAGSVLAAFASDPWHLIACRAIMGLGAAFAMPSTLSILITVFDPSEQRQAMAAWTVVGMVGVVAGPTLGGLLLEHYWWGSAFLVNVPIAIAGIIAAFVLVPESRGPARPADPVGALLSLAGMVALVWAIISLPHDGWSGQVIGSLLVAGAVGAAFVAWESRREHPLLPLGMFRDRRFSGASLSVVLLVFATGALLLALTQYLQFVLGYGPMKAGLALAPYAVAVAICNGLGATLGKKLSNRTLTVAGMLVIAAGFAVLAAIGPDDGYPMLIAGLVVMGIGAGLAGPAVYASLMGAIPREHAGVGSAVNDTVQQAGLALSVAILGSVLSGAYKGALPADTAIPESARASIADTLAVATATGNPALAATAREAFVSAMSIGNITGVVCCVAGAALAFAVLRDPTPPTDPRQVEA